jgi:hypothetical protein
MFDSLKCGRERNLVKTNLSPQPAIEDRIEVLISSSQGEFGKIRGKLKERIDDFRLGRRYVFKADLVESMGGEIIQGDINKALENCAIYILIIGHRDSAATLDELKDAWIRGIPILVYDYRRRRSKKSGRNRLVRYVESQKDKGLRISVPDFPYTDENDLINHVLRDLPSKLGEITSKFVRVRGIISRKGKFGGGLS